MFPNGTPQIQISLATLLFQRFAYQIRVSLCRGVSLRRGAADAENPERDSNRRCWNSHRRSATGVKISSINVA